MGIIQSFERRLQGAVGNTFARLFGGSVHPSEVITALQDEANNRLTQDGGRLVAPNHFKVRLGPTDRKGIGEDEQRVATALSDTIREYLAEQGYETFGDIEVELEEAPSLHTGQFRVSSLVDPDAGPRRPSTRSGGRPVTPSDQGRDQPYRENPPSQPYRQPQPHDPQPAHQQPGYQHGYEPQAHDAHRDARYSDPRQSDARDSDARQYGYGRQGYPEVVATLHTDDGSGRSYQLVPGSNIVGRGQDAEFRLPDTSVSRRHLDIYFDGHIAVMHDLGSTNGTTVNSTIVQTWQLADGDVVRLGHSTIIFSQRG